MKLLAALFTAVAACATVPAPQSSALTAPRCVPSCQAGFRCFQPLPHPGWPIQPPFCIPN